MPGYKVLFHIDENTRWQLVLNNVRNLIEDMGSDNLLIEVVANGDAVRAYSAEASDMQDRMKSFMAELSHKGVVFTSCRNAMKAHGINEKSIEDFVKTVSAGVGEIVIRQSEGYLYIRP